MAKVLQESEVSVESLIEVLTDSGWQASSPHSEKIIVRSDNGLALNLYIDSERKYIEYRVYFELCDSFTDQLDLIQELNSQYFLAKFHIDKDGDLVISYVLIYQNSLLCAHLTRTLRRFSGLADCLVDEYRDKHLLAFLEEQSSDDGEDEQTVKVPAAATLQ